MNISRQRHVYRTSNSSINRTRSCCHGARPTISTSVCLSCSVSSIIPRLVSSVHLWHYTISDDQPTRSTKQNDTHMKILTVRSKSKKRKATIIKKYNSLNISCNDQIQSIQVKFKAKVKVKVVGVQIRLRSWDPLPGPGQIQTRTKTRSWIWIPTRIHGAFSATAEHLVDLKLLLCELLN